MSDAENIIKLKENYKDRNLIFIDILGFSEKVEGFEKNYLNNSDINFLAEYINLFIDNFSDLKSKIVLLSDTIVICFEEDFLQLMWRLSYALIILNDIGYYFRGTVHRGKVYLEEKNNMIMGSALIEAHKIEREHAIYPRILVTESFKDYLIKENSKSYPYLINRDFDGLDYIDYLGYLHFTEKKYFYDEDKGMSFKSIVSSFEKIVDERRRLKQSGKMKEFSKMFYLQNYYTEFAKRIQDQELIQKFKKINNPLMDLVTILK